MVSNLALFCLATYLAIFPKIGQFFPNHLVTLVVVPKKDFLNLPQVDHMTRPSPNYHKCLLLEDEIPAITYNSGGTYTLGALMQAIDVFQVTFLFSGTNALAYFFPLEICIIQGQIL